MSIEIEKISNKVRLHTLQTGDLFKFHDRIFMVTNHFLGTVMERDSRLCVCITNGRTFTYRDFFPAYSNPLVVPVKNVKLQILDDIDENE